MSAKNKKEVKLKERVYTSFGYIREQDISEEARKKMQQEGRSQDIRNAYAEFYINKTKRKKKD